MNRFSPFLYLFSFLLLILCSSFARADEPGFTPVQVMYMIRDPASKTGYREAVQWSITTPGDWNRFYNNISSLPQDTSTNPDPLKNQVEDMIVLTHTDPNGLTGYDIYISNLGIMTIMRGASHSYYKDNNKLRAFLEEEQKNRAAFDNFLENRVSRKSMGIVVTFNINNSLPNPTWLVDDPENIRLYDSFFKALTPLRGRELGDMLDRENFDNLGHFIVTLNYPDAPAQIAVIGKGNIRLSNNAITSQFYQDTGNYYTFFRDQAREMVANKEKLKEQEVKSIIKRQF